jgi:hypothetical protein
MARLDIDLTGTEGLTRMRRILEPKLFEKALRGGVKYAADAVPPAVAKGITASYNIPSRRVKDDVLGTRFSGDGSSATIRFSRRPPTLTQFRPNPGRRGRQPGLGRGRGWGPAKPAGRPVTATIIKANGRQTFPGAFVATGANANRLVLRRTPNDQLEGVYGPSIGSIFLGNSAIGTQLRADVKQRINEQYIKGVQRVLDSAARGYGR